MATEIAGTFNPPMLNPSEVNISTGQRVTGLMVSEEFHAYLVEAVVIVQDHVINPWVGGSAVSVTSYNQTDFVPVVTSAKYHGAINLRVDGLLKGASGPKLVLMLDGTT